MVLVLPIQLMYTYVFVMILTIKRVNFPEQHEPVDLCNGDEPCSLRSRN